MTTEEHCEMTFVMDVLNLSLFLKTTRNSRALTRLETHGLAVLWVEFRADSFSLPQKPACSLSSHTCTFHTSHLEVCRSCQAVRLKESSYAVKCAIFFNRNLTYPENQ